MSTSALPCRPSLQSAPLNLSGYRDALTLEFWNIIDGCAPGGGGGERIMAIDSTLMKPLGQMVAPGMMAILILSLSCIF